MEKLKVLVVDDESRMRKLVKDFLVKENFEVLEAGDGEEALDVFFQEKDIALILLDVMMPKMDGCFLPGKRYCPDPPGRDDAENGWMAGLQGNKELF